MRDRNKKMEIGDTIKHGIVGVLLAAGERTMGAEARESELQTATNPFSGGRPKFPGLCLHSARHHMATESFVGPSPTRVTITRWQVWGADAVHR